MLNRQNLKGKGERQAVMGSVHGYLSCSRIQGDGEAFRMNVKME